MGNIPFGDSRLFSVNTDKLGCYNKILNGVFYVLEESLFMSVEVPREEFRLKCGVRRHCT